MRRRAAGVVGAAVLAVAGFALAQALFSVSVSGPAGTTTATEATVTVSANGTAFFSCSFNGTPVDCGRVGTTGVATMTGLTLGAQTFVAVARSYHSKTTATGALTWTVVAATTSTTNSTSSTAASTTSTTTATSVPTSTGGGRHHRTSPWWYVLAGGAAGAALTIGAFTIRGVRRGRGVGAEIEVSTEEPKGPCRQKARRRHVKATLLPARRTIAHLTLAPEEGETATIAGELVDALNDAVRRYRHRGAADEARLVTLPRDAASEVAVAAHLEGGKLEVVQRLYGCVEGEWKPVGPEVKVEVADERDERVATTTRPASAESEQRLVERLAAFVGRVDVTRPTPVEPPRSAQRAL